MPAKRNSEKPNANNVGAAWHAAQNKRIQITKQSIIKEKTNGGTKENEE